MPVRKLADWITQTDERILELLASDGLNTPSDIAEDPRVSVSRAHCNVRLTRLNDEELVENVGNGVYRITSKGADLLSGDLDLT